MRLNNNTMILFSGVVMSEKQREAFEAWVSTRSVVKKHGAKLAQRVDGSYSDYRINDRWLSWKAAIASVVVELPPRMRGIDEACRINNKAVDMMQARLESAGVKYK